MSSHLDEPTGDSAMGILGFAVLVILFVLYLLMQAPGAGDIYAGPAAAPTTTMTSTSTTVASTTTTRPPVATTVKVRPAPARAGVNWDLLADCESGTWDAQKQPIPGTRNWADQRGGYEGGVHFAPSTWDSFKPAGYPDGAHQATRAQQIHVAELVLAKQGPGAWPDCSRKVGLR